jgi:hypothetical protein
MRRDVLERLPDVVPLFARSGQILFYPRHTPPGLFIVLAGALRRFGTGDGERLEAGTSPFAVPALEELAGPASAGIVAETDVEMLFVPRSVAMRQTRFEETLTAAGVTTVSLGGRVR